MPEATIALLCCLDAFARFFEQWDVTTCSPQGGSAGEAARSPLARCSSSWCCCPSRYKDCKPFWHDGLRHEYRSCFEALPRYDRFVSLLPPRLLPPRLLLHYFRGEKTGITFAESTKLAVRHNAGISRNRVLQGLAKRGGTTMDWFLASSSTSHSP